MAPLPRPEPFDPLRKGLYTADELMAGYTSANPDGALDRRIARHFVAAGGRNPPSAAEAIAQRLHDFGIDRALTAWLGGNGGAAPKVVGVMGSHSTPRDDPQYALVAELGWRLARGYWDRGFASEAARAVVADGFDRIGLEEIVSFTVPANMRSWRVMERLGMTHDPVDDFDHPRLPVGHRLRRHVLYRLKRTGYK